MLVVEAARDAAADRSMAAALKEKGLPVTAGRGWLYSTVQHGRGMLHS